MIAVYLVIQAPGGLMIDTFTHKGDRASAVVRAEQIVEEHYAYPSEIVEIRLTMIRKCREQEERATQDEKEIPF